LSGTYTYSEDALLRFLMVIMMVGVIFIEPDVDIDPDADTDAEVMS